MASSQHAPVGLVGLELHGCDALLRSLVVDPTSRTEGIGSQLVEHAENYARARGVESVYLLTTTAESFFARRGYARVDRRNAPESISTTREFSSICPASSAFMLKRL
jgi:amino-acid N-acetyltransferase